MIWDEKKVQGLLRMGETDTVSIAKESDTK